MIVKYSMSMGTIKRTGTMHIATDGTNVAIADSFVETSLSSLTFNGVISGGQMLIRQTNSEINPITITLDITRIKE